MSISYIIAQIIQHHVTIEHPRVFIKTLLSKAIIIIPRFHLRYHLLNIPVQLPRFLIITKHLTHFHFTESQQHIKLRLCGNIPSDIKTARQVVQSHRADASHKNTVKHPFKLLEYIAIETTGMRQGMVDFLPFFIQHRIGEVIIFVNDKIKKCSRLFCLQVEVVEFIRIAFQLLHLLRKSRIIIRFISRCYIIQNKTAIIVKIPFQRLYVSANT